MADIRAFIALEISPEIIARLIAVQRHLRDAAAQVTWVRPEGIHLTLKFLGNMPEERVPEIIRVLEIAATAQGPFRAGVAGMGAFPNLRRPRVIWAGIAQGAEACCVLAQAVEQQCAALGFPPEERPFSPHLTLGRVKSPVGVERLIALLREHDSEQFGEMPVTELRLIRSELFPDGARYTTLRQIPLTGV